MRNKRSTVVTAVLITGTCALLATFVAPEPVIARGGKDDCEEFKKQITELQDQLQKLTAQIENLTQKFDEADKKIQSMDEFAENHLWKVKAHDASLLAQEEGDWLTIRSKWVQVRNSYKRQIEDNRLTIQAINDVIGDLLNKLVNCGAKTTPTPKATPTPNSTPTPGKNAGNALGYHVDTKTANGLLVTTFDTPQGKIKVNLTDDVAAGDTISGTVETEPAGKNDAERTQNQAELNGYVIELGGQKTIVGDKKITCNIPTTLTSDAKTIVLVHNGQRVVTSEVPIAITPPPTPTQFTLPTGGQQGRPIEIKGPCRGAFSPQDYVKIGETVLPPVAKSPRKIVVQNTSNTVGPSTIECKENGVTVQCPFRIIGVRLRAAKLNLRSGETTVLTVEVMGFKGIEEDEDASLDLINDSTGVIKMSGGDVQHYKIKASPVQADGTLQVRPDGTCSFDRTLTGIRPGGFGVTANVKWSNVCRRP